MLRFLTAGESHGKALVAIIDGLPAGLKIDIDFINLELKKRQSGYGRGARMRIEKDTAEILSGIRRGKTIGSPVAVLIKNKDFTIERMHSVFCPRPGHADLAGALKFKQPDMRNILERASARETAARTAIGALCKLMLAEFNIEIINHVVAIGNIRANMEDLTLLQIKSQALKSKLFCADKKAALLMQEKIDTARDRNDTLGGIFEIIALGLPPGLGSYTQFDLRLNSCLLAAVSSIPAIKGVEVGLGFECASRFGSAVHDAIFYSHKNGFYRLTNNAGGIEGGMSNGEPIVLRAAMKPIATLLSPLDSVSIKTKRSQPAQVERSDICAVPAASVAASAMVAFELSKAFLTKFGADSLDELKTNYRNHIKTLR
ncbi:MAG: chorismate synthase [Candidatus Omnitrophota bacterium]